MHLLVGLGNPGPSYAGHRHNLGFMVLDEIVRRHGFGPFRARFRGRLAEGLLHGEKVLALEPTTYMNESGASVGEAVRFYKIPLERVIVLYDEIDLAPGKVRVKRGGGAGGHNGIRSLDSHLGKDYWRVRIGVGHPGEKHLVERYVLSDFRKEERPLVDKVVDAVAEAIPLLVAGQDGRFMNRVSTLINPPRPKPKPTAGDEEQTNTGADGDGL
ncbi:MAG: aminoacyl-tRNA hydrolase [Alphaproteobacteria bacterium]|nr:aminoacyl-tRNA hydrolase [Alphaproteobacteria bacterium]